MLYCITVLQGKNYLSWKQLQIRREMVRNDMIRAGPAQPNTMFYTLTDKENVILSTWQNLVT